MKIFFRNKDLVLAKNQSIIIIEICSYEYQNVLKNYSNINSFESLSKLFEKYNSKINSELIKLDNEIDYLCSLLNVLSNSSEERNHITESKCQKYFPLNTLKNLLNISKECWIFRKCIYFFFYHVYLDTEREINEEKSIVIEILKVN